MVADFIKGCRSVSVWKRSENRNKINISAQRQLRLKKKEKERNDRPLWEIRQKRNT